MGRKQPAEKKEFVARAWKAGYCRKWVASAYWATHPGASLDIETIRALIKWDEFWADMEKRDDELEERYGCTIHVGPYEI